MSRVRALIIVAVILVFLVVGAVLALRGLGGGGAKVSLDARVTGSSMRPATLTAHHDDTVTLTLTTDRDEEIHLHGYDVPFECRAGQPLSKTFKADKTGQFDIEIEDTSTHLGELDVT